ncbi:MAG: T9SS type A sorting domain-containing protein [Bacteroidales bacterium]
MRGTGAITFAGLRSGNNNAQELVLERSVTVMGLMHLYNAAGYLDLGNHTLNVFGDYYRQSGQFRGSAGAILNLGNGNNLGGTNGSVFFQEGYRQLASLNHNVVNSSIHYVLISPLSVGNLSIVSGELQTSQNLVVTKTYNNLAGYRQTANTTTFENPGGTIEIAGAGTHNFWNLEVGANTSVTTSQNLMIQRNFVSGSDAPEAFKASAGSVSFVANNIEQFISGTGTGEVEFFDLDFPIRGNKFISRNIRVANNLTINSPTTTLSVYLDHNANHTLDLNHVVLGGSGSGRFLVRSGNTMAHTVTINGTLTVNPGSTFSTWATATRYADVTMTGIGTLIQGNGAISFRNLFLSGAGEKSFSTSSNIQLYGASNSPNIFRNDGGALTTHQGHIIFRENDREWFLQGNGEIHFRNLQVGANTRTNVILERDIHVTNNLIFDLNNANHYLALNGHRLHLSGDHRRVRNGRIRGAAGSSITITGAGNFTSTFLFDQTDSGNSNRVDHFVYDRGENGEMRLANLLVIGNLLEAEQGVFNAFSGSIQINPGATAHFKEATFMDTDNGGFNSFLGSLQVDPNAVFHPTSNSIMNLGGTLEVQGGFTKEGSGIVNFLHNTSLSGDTTLLFLNGDLMLATAVRVVNQMTSDSLGVMVMGRINGADATSVWENRGILTYHNAGEPMATGQLDASSAGNKVFYAREANNQDVKGAIYHHLIFTGEGTRFMRGLVQVNGNLSIEENTTLDTREWQITGNPTGFLTMGEESNLIIGRNVATPNPEFPSGFIRENILLDELSLVSYNGQPQTISAVPIYSNLAITNGGGDKTLGGDVTVKGYLQIATGTLAFGTTQAQTLRIEGDLVGSGGRIDMNRGGHPHELHLLGVINQVNRFNYAPGAIVRYLSSQDQQIFAFNNSADYYSRLEIAGGSNKWMEGHVRVNDELILTSGRLRLGDFNLTLHQAAVSGAFGPDAMVETNGEGYLQKQDAGNSPYTHLLGLYPVGSKGRYSPVEVHEISGTGSNRYFRVRAIPERHPSVVQTYDALVRYWQVETNAGNGNARATFHFSPLDVIGDPEKYKAYRWHSSDFHHDANTTVAETSFSLNIPLAIQGQWTAFDTETIRETFYSYMDGDWNFLDTWTTDPSGQLLEGDRIPGSSDNVVILPGRTVHLTQNMDIRGVNIDIRESGALDMRTYQFDHVVSTLKGQGLLKLASNAMPLVALNLFVENEGGTVEYNVATPVFELNDQSHYNNLTINLPLATSKAILVNNLEVFGDLRISRGGLQIYRDDATSTQHLPINLTIHHDLVVEEQGFISTGTASTSNGSVPPAGTTPGALVPRYFDMYHKLHVGGSFFNEGTVRLFSPEITQIDFQNLTTRGAVTTRFFGDTDAVLLCAGNTDFYNLIIDKGTGAGAELELHAEQPQFFRLFGPNHLNAGNWGINPEVRKALWLRNGTLRLTGNTTLASLTEGRGGTHSSAWIIPANAALILDSPGVTVLATADTPNEVQAAWGVASHGVHKDNFPQELLVLGSLTVNDGYLSTRMSGGIVYARAGGEVIINGGVVNARQLRTAHAGSSFFTMTGGVLELLGTYHHQTTHINTLEELRSAPIDMTTSNNWRMGGHGTFNLGYVNNVFQMSGGIINIYNTSGGGTQRALRILSEKNSFEATAGDIHIHLIRNTIYDVEIPLGTLHNLHIHKTADTHPNAYIRLLSPLRIGNNLQLNGFARLNTNTQNYDLYVGRNFTIGSHAMYIPRQNNTYWVGEQNSQLILHGTIQDGFYNLHMAKDGEQTLSFSGPASAIVVRGDLHLTGGVLDDSGKTLRVQRHAFNSAKHTGSGKILMSGASVNRNLGGNGLGIWGNLELNETDAILTQLTAHQHVQGNLTMTQGRLHLSSHMLELQGSLIPADPAHYNANRMISTDGNHSDAGLKRWAHTEGGLHFPLGTLDEGEFFYTPALLNIATPSSPGFIQLNPVAGELPTLNPDAEPALQYYWRLRTHDFSETPQGSVIFHYLPVFVVEEGDDEEYKPGKVVFNQRSFEPTGVDTHLKTIAFPVHELKDASYTAAHENRFDGLVPVFYSRLPQGHSWYERNWNNTSNWSNVSHNPAAPAASRWPGAGDIVYIGYWDYASGNRLHSMNVPNGFTAEAAEVILLKNPTDGASRLVLHQTSGARFGSLSGTGVLQMRLTPGNTPQLVGDLGEYLAHSDNQVIYQMVADGTMALPDYIHTYPNLRLEASNNSTLPNRIALINQDIRVEGDLNIDWGARMQFSNAVGGTFSVGGTTVLGTNGTITAGSIEFPAGHEWTFESGRIEFRSNASNRIMVHNSSDGLLHTLRINGTGISMENGSINLSHTGSGNNVQLEFTGTEAAVFHRTGGNPPQLHNLVVNKGINPDAPLHITTDFVLNALTDLAQKPIVLQNGTLILDHPAFSQEISTGGGLWQIPATAALEIRQGALNLTANGINLRGRLALTQNGQLLMGGLNGNRIVIQYEGITPQIQLADNARLEVNTQIRRATNTLNGALRYQQSGGTLIIHGTNTNNNRARLEVTNTGSEFTMSGGSIYIRRGSGNLFGDLWLTPQNMIVTGGDIYLSQGTIPEINGVPGYPLINSNYNFRLNSTGELHNLHIGSDPGHNRRATLILMQNPLRLGNDLVFLNPLAQINTSNRDVELLGDLHFQGQWIRGSSDRLIFSGITQTLHGSPELTHLWVQSTNSLSLAPGAEPLIHGNLQLVSGQLVDGGNPIRVKGDVANHAQLISSAPANPASGLKLAGETTQRVSGSGSFGLMEMNNIMGANLQNSITLQHNLILTRGTFNIGSHLLTLEESAGIISAQEFSAQNMILTDGIAGNNAGIRKHLPAGASAFTFPIGVHGKYTPVELDITASTPGHVLVKPVNLYHITALDTANVLRYHWIMESAGLDNLTGEATMHYIQSDVRGPEDQYLAARFRDNVWQKFANDDDFTYVDIHANTIRFLFGEGDNLNGEYSAGLDEAFSETILTFTSTKDGPWDDLDIWERSDGMPVVFLPAGVNVVIGGNTRVWTNGNRRQAYSVTIDGRLEVDQTYGHNFGTIRGSGTLSSHRNTLPAGKYDEFFSTPGSTMEYGGPLSFTLIPDYTTTFQNLVIAGSGVKTLPNQTIIILSDLELMGSATLQSNLSQRIILHGNLVKRDAAKARFDYNGQWLEMAGSSPQIIEGTFLATQDRLWNLEINNPTHVQIIGAVFLGSGIRLTQGILYTDSQPITVNWNADNAVIASAGSFIEGGLERRLSGTMSNAFFPVGRNGQRKDVRLRNQTAGYWSVEYFDHTAPYDTESMDSNQLEWVNDLEYWAITGPAGGQARVELNTRIHETYPWYGHPELPDYLHVAQWDAGNGQWISRGQAQYAETAGGNFRLQAAISSSFSTQYFTVGQSAEVSVLPIELLSFTGKAQQDAILLEWVTASEINNHFFTLERSFNGRDFHIVAVVASQAEYGFSNQNLYYSNLDLQPREGMNYYRLKQTDFDGSYEYSKVIGVLYQQQQQVSFSLFPNPNRGNSFSIALNQLRPFEQVELQITDLNGRSYHNIRYQADNAGMLSAYLIPPYRLPAGIYLVTVSGTSGRFVVRMVVN